MKILLSGLCGHMGAEVAALAKTGYRDAEVVAGTHVYTMPRRVTCAFPISLFCLNNGIAVQAYAPLARGAYLNRSIIEKIAEKYNRSTAQIGLRWLIQKDICPIPKSVHTARILSNSQIFDFELDEVEMQMLDSMNENFRSANPPDDLII